MCADDTFYADTILLPSAFFYATRHHLPMPLLRSDDFEADGLLHDEIISSFTAFWCRRRLSPRLITMTRWPLRDYFRYAAALRLI